MSQTHDPIDHKPPPLFDMVLCACCTIEELVTTSTFHKILKRKTFYLQTVSREKGTESKTGYSCASPRRTVPNSTPPPQHIGPGPVCKLVDVC